METKQFNAKESKANDDVHQLTTIEIGDHKNRTRPSTSADENKKSG